MSKKLFVSGIGTGVGKTMASAMFVKKWNADYWKPVQSGDLAASDSMMVHQLLDGQVRIHPERYRLQTPASPHYAAAIDGLEIKLSDFMLPETEANLIVEGAGGLFVPLNEQHFMIDLIAQLGLPVVLVLSDYLGCINHSLLSLEALKSRGIPVANLLFNGPFLASTKQLIQAQVGSETSCMDLPWLEKLSAEELNKHVF